jgi:hypothetical protein
MCISRENPVWNIWHPLMINNFEKKLLLLQIFVMKMNDLTICIMITSSITNSKKYKVINEGYLLLLSDYYKNLDYFVLFSTYSLAVTLTCILLSSSP